MTETNKNKKDTGKIAEREMKKENISTTVEKANATETTKKDSEAGKVSKEKQETNKNEAGLRKKKMNSQTLFIFFLVVMIIVTSLFFIYTKNAVQSFFVFS